MVQLNYSLPVRKYKIGTRPFFYPMHCQPIFKEMGIFENKIFPISENLYKKGFYLPSGINLNEEDINEVCEKFMMIYK